MATNKGLTTALRRAKTTGDLRLQNRGLEDIPIDVIMGLREGDHSDTKDAVKWWEQGDLTALDVSGNKIRCLAEGFSRMLKDCPALESFKANKNGLQVIQVDLFDSQLKRLELKHNKLETFELPGNSKLSPLMILDASWNSIKALNNDFMCLGMLTTVDLSHNNIVDARVFRDFSQCVPMLRELNLSHNKIKRFPERFLEECSALTHVNLANNQLEEPPIYLPTLSLTSVDLGNNNLQEWFAFSGRDPALKLREVNVAGNNLKTVPRALPQAAPNITVLNMSSCRLTDLCAEIADLKGLTVLDVSMNDLKDVPPQLGLMESLNKLLLAGNALRRIPSSKLQLGTVKLKKYLATRLTDADRAAFKARNVTEAERASQQLGRFEVPCRDMVSSEVLDLSRITDEKQWQAVPWTDLEAPLYAALDAMEAEKVDYQGNPMENNWLREIVLTGHKLSSVDQLIGAIGKSVETLTLSKNNFSDVPKSMSYKLPSLKALRLSHNQIRGISSDALLDCKNLTSVDLSFNKLQEFPMALLDLAPTLRVLELQNNALTELPSLQYLTQLTHLDVSTNKIRRMASGLRYCRTLEFLNLENNNLTNLPLELGVCTRLNTLMVIGNPLRLIKPSLQSKGAEVLREYLLRKIPNDSPLRQPLDPLPARQRREQPRQQNAQRRASQPRVQQQQPQQQYQRQPEQGRQQQQQQRVRPQPSHGQVSHGYAQQYQQREYQQQRRNSQPGPLQNNRPEWNTQFLTDKPPPRKVIPPPDQQRLRPPTEFTAEEQSQYNQEMHMVTQLTAQMEDFGTSNAKKYALKKDIAKARARANRLKRTLDARRQQAANGF